VTRVEVAANRALDRVVRGVRRRNRFALLRADIRPVAVSFVWLSWWGMD